MLKYVFYLTAGLTMFVIAYVSWPIVRQKMRHRRRRQERRRVRQR